MKTDCFSFIGLLICLVGSSCCCTGTEAASVPTNAVSGASAPASLEEAKQGLASATNYDWKLKGSWLAGIDGGDKLYFSVIPNPRTSESGRAIAQEFCTVHSFFQSVVAQNDRFVLIQTVDVGSELKAIQRVLKLEAVTNVPPLSLDKFVVRECGLVWNGIKLERRKNKAQPDAAATETSPRR